jgi:Flp pilus assembly protein TadB
MKTAILVVLLLVLVVLGGIYWNQVRERDDRLKAEAAAQAERQKVEAERLASERRNQESARQAAEAERKLQEQGL